MGLFDDVAGKVMGGMRGGQGGSGNLLGMVTELIQQSGGLSGLLQKFEGAGMGDLVSSWVGNGENQPVEAGQVSAALGGDTLNHLASKFGVDAGEVSGMLAQVLPQAVDGLTPNGEVDDSTPVSESGLAGMLGGLFKR